ncbi:unnamed protein product [Albugo candida]|uniref:Uncharacterized protein n=1 Tax=Albugo candida TaxID=65357 RepID=A0A024FXP8_9STRA|nr:unnamed protein product [Albugo candida]|eukprot:CCI39334.1 unnamed protein product [Albugo candida]
MKTDRKQINKVVQPDHSLKTSSASSCHILSPFPFDHRNNCQEMDYSIIASELITNIKSGGTAGHSNGLSKIESQQWNGKFLLGLHEPMRHCICIMNSLFNCLMSSSSSPKKALSTFFRWYRKYFMVYIKCQYRVKTKLLFPFLHLRYNEKLRILESYTDIIALMEKILERKNSLHANPRYLDDDTRKSFFLTRIQEDIQKLGTIVNETLTIEERLFHPALSRTFTEDEFVKYMMPKVFHIIRPKRAMIPWIIECSKPWDQQRGSFAYKNALSFFHRIFYKLFWYRHWKKNVLVPMQSMVAPELL